MRREVATAALVAVAAAACRGGPDESARATPRAAPPSAAPRDAAIVLPQQEPRPLQDYGPEILLPDPKAVDAEVARVGDLALRQSQAFARLLYADPKLALSAVDLLVFDVLVARHAQEFDIRVPQERVRELADAEEQQLRRQVEGELAGQMTFPDYVWRMFGMPLDAWQRTVELRVAQRLYQGYVIRYLALREDRVRVRYIVNKDRAVVESARNDVAQGADFATLALRVSEDALRREGGLLPPFGLGFPHPVADVALQLPQGKVSDVFERAGRDGVTRYYLVFCLERLAGRDVPFAQVHAEIDRELVDKPLSPIETNAYTLRWRAAVETKTDDKPPAGR